MTTVTLQEAQAHLKELIGKLADGEELLIVDDQQPVARLVGERQIAGQRPAPGNCSGMLRIIADDDEHLLGFEEYLP